MPAHGLNVALGRWSAVASTLTGSSTSILLRVLKPEKANPLQTIQYDRTISVLLTPLGMLATGSARLPPWAHWCNPLLLAGIAVLSLVGQTCRTRALQVEMVSNLTMLAYLRIVISFLQDIFVFDQAINFYSVCGSVIIVGSSLMLLLFKKQDKG